MDLDPKTFFLWWGLKQLFLNHATDHSVSFEAFRSRNYKIRIKKFLLTMQALEDNELCKNNFP